MLVGTLLLGLLLGYLIWGWVKGRVKELERQLAEQSHIAQLKESQMADLQTRLQTLQQEADRTRNALRMKESQYAQAIDKIKAISEVTDPVSAEPPAKARPKPPPAVPASPRVTTGTPVDVTPPEKDKEEASRATEPPARKPQPLRKGSTKASLAIAAEVMGSKIAANDLKIVEGIGPKIEEILRAKGIKTWARLAQSRLPDLRQILEDAGPRYRLANPKTWPRQARMAAKGEWKKLKAYQETLKGGRES